MVVAGPLAAAASAADAPGPISRSADPVPIRTGEIGYAPSAGRSAGESDALTRPDPRRSHVLQNPGNQSMIRTFLRRSAVGAIAGKVSRAFHARSIRAARSEERRVGNWWNG